MKDNFDNANQAFNYYWKFIKNNGIDFDNTKAIFNCGFLINNPEDNYIKNKKRNWNIKYAQAEWDWYLSEDPCIDTLKKIYGKIPPIWEKMADNFRMVRSNYGWQWSRGGQLDYIVNKLKNKHNTRHATISIYDGKENHNYTYDTPCTYAVQFTIIDNKLNMSVYMRSNDLWYGFCNDQFCFSELQKLISKKIKIKIGTYYHHAHNMHIYNNKLNNKL